MKHLASISLVLFICSSAFFTGCGDDDDSGMPPGNPNDTTMNDTTMNDTTNTDTTMNSAGCDVGLDENKVVFGSVNIDIDASTMTCNPNAFGIPRFGLRGENSDNSFSINVELRGTAPENGSTFTIDPDLGGGTSRVKLFYDAKNWTSTLDANNMITFVSEGSKQSTCGANVLVANDRDAAETMMVSFNIACQ